MIFQQRSEEDECSYGRSGVIKRDHKQRWSDRSPGGESGIQTMRGLVSHCKDPGFYPRWNGKYLFLSRIIVFMCCTQLLSPVQHPRGSPIVFISPSQLEGGEDLVSHSQLYLHNLEQCSAWRKCSVTLLNVNECMNCTGAILNITTGHRN